MKRKTKSSGSGGRLRLGLLLATAAAFLLIPAAQALAVNPPATVVFEGAGAGWVKGGLPEEEGGGTPYLQCHWNGAEIDTGMEIAIFPKPGICETRLETLSGLTAIAMKAEADPGSDLVGWVVEEGTPLGGCSNPVSSQAEECIPASFGGVPVKVKAIFALEPGIPLTLTTSGSGSGSFQCDTGSGAEACKAEYPEGTEVEVSPVDGTGSDFVEFNAENGGECSGATCTVTMSAPRTVNAKFDLETLAFATTVIGEGSVQCSVNAGALGACPSSATYGDEIEVVATPNSIEYVLAEISGTGSATGCTASPCSFTVTAPSSVTAEFKTAAFKSEAEVETVHGNVPETTTLASACESVDLGEFVPGVTADYPNTCVVTLTSTGAETKLTASDPSATQTGHLVQGTYFLPSALEVKAEDSEGKGTGPGLTPLSPVTLLTFGEPIGQDATTLTFSQHIDQHDGLHTGEYAKTILLTLEQTA